MLTSIWEPEVQAVLDQPKQVIEREVNIDGQSRTIRKPFVSPSDWRNQWIYFLLVDRFNKPGGLPFPEYGVDTSEMLGGTFNGIREKLGYLERLGVGAIWLSPVLKNTQYKPHAHHGYWIQDFLSIDPRFGSNPEDSATAEAELIELIDAAHARGIYIIMDIVLNHTGSLFNYEGAMETRSWRHDGHYTVYWRKQDGTPVGNWTDPSAVADPHQDELIWPRELQRNDYFRRKGENTDPSVPEWMGDFHDLRELVTEYQLPGPRFPLRDILIRAYQYLIARFDIDGYRIDTLKYVQPQFARVFGNAMREYAASIGKTNFLTFGEVWENDNEQKIASYIGRYVDDDSQIIGVDSALDFPVYKRLDRVIRGGEPPCILADHLDMRREVLKRFVSSHGEASRFYVTFLDNHDLNERFAGGQPDEKVTLALTCLFALQGIPCVYYGTEQGLNGSGSRRECVREPLWGKGFDEHHLYYRTVQTLSSLRCSEPALRFGRCYMRPVSGDAIHFGHSPYPNGVLAFSRILNDREIVVVANTSGSESVEVSVIVDKSLNPDGTQFRVLFSNQPDPVIPKPVVNHGFAQTHSPASMKITLHPMESLVLGR